MRTRVSIYTIKITTHGDNVLTLYGVNKKITTHGDNVLTLYRVVNK